MDLFPTSQELVEAVTLKHILGLEKSYSQNHTIAFHSVKQHWVHNIQLLTSNKNA